MWSLRSWTESIWPEGQPWASLLGTQRSEAVEPIEIATVALFLASEDSKFVNGTVIAADGGWRRINP
ncbi:SDR family oxidoreductase [Paenibacillus sp. FSL L8-0340]|uniref:SDR family oxidoreductase n=1 Tax=Paenibacillus sp. FSL L8-0340 TaxID=2954685 RepID=UPI0031197952